MGWFDEWFTSSWFGTVSNVSILCAVETLSAKTAVPPVTVQTDQRLTSEKSPLTVSLTLMAPGLSLGTKPGLATLSPRAGLLAPTVMTVVRQDVAVAAEPVTTKFLNLTPEGRTASRMAVPILTLRGTMSPTLVGLGAGVPVKMVSGNISLAPIGLATGVRLIPDRLAGRWSLPQKGTGVVIEI